MTRQIPTLDQLRKDIDDGRTGEKMGWPDPAAAPLGTDEEASGNPPTLQERAIAASSQPTFRRRRSSKAWPLVVYLTACGVISAVLLTVIALNS